MQTAPEYPRLSRMNLIDVSIALLAGICVERINAGVVAAERNGTRNCRPKIAAIEIRAAQDALDAVTTAAVPAGRLHVTVLALMGDISAQRHLEAVL